MVSNKSLIFNSVPTGYPVPGETTKLVSGELDVEAVALNGGFVSKSAALSLDPYMRGRMRDPEKTKSYSPAFELGKPLGTLGVSTVVRSAHPGFPVGAHVYGFHPMSEYNVFPEGAIAPSGLKVIDDSLGLPLTQWCGAAGMVSNTSPVFFSHEKKSA